MGKFVGLIILEAITIESTDSRAAKSPDLEVLEKSPGIISKSPELGKF